MRLAFSSIMGGRSDMSSPTFLSARVFIWMEKRPSQPPQNREEYSMPVKLGGVGRGKIGRPDPLDQILDAEDADKIVLFIENKKGPMPGFQNAAAGNQGFERGHQFTDGFPDRGVHRYGGVIGDAGHDIPCLFLNPGQAACLNGVGFVDFYGQDIDVAGFGEIIESRQLAGIVGRIRACRGR